MLLTLDLGTSATKAALVGETGPAATARCSLETSHPRPGWAEQDPESWWDSVLRVCAELRAGSPDAWSRVRAIGFSAARESFAPVDENGAPLGPGILWSDRRADAEAAALGDSEEWRQRTGVPLDAGAVPAKVAWLGRHAPEQLKKARWLLAPRDLVVLRLTGEALTDPTLASRTGLFTLGELAPVDDTAARLVPPRRPSAEPAATLERTAADTLGLPRDVAVVPGAGDRACEVLGTGATAQRPMVSWGTTANLSTPAGGVPDPLPPGVAVSAGALGGVLVESGLSAAGSALHWLAQLTGRSTEELDRAAAAVDPGARGVSCLPWFNGARAPWWETGARAGFTGLSAAHGPADLARALYEGIAFDVSRALDRVAPAVELLTLAGGGAASETWREVLSGATGCGLLRRRSDEAGTVGAALLTGRAVGADLEVDDLNPVLEEVNAAPTLVGRYAALRARHDEAAAAVVGLAVGW